MACRFHKRFVTLCFRSGNIDNRAGLIKPIATRVTSERPLAAGNFPNFAVIHFKNVIKRGAIGLGEHPGHSHAEKRMIIAARPTDVTPAGNHGKAAVPAEIEMRLKQG